MDKHRFPLIIEAREIYPELFQGGNSKRLPVYHRLDMDCRLRDIMPPQHLKDLANCKNGYRMVLLNLLLIPQSKLEVRHRLSGPLHPLLV